MVTKLVLRSLFMVVLGTLSFAISQGSVTAIENLDRFLELQALDEGASISTSVLVCNEKPVLLAVLAAMQDQPNVTEPVLADDLQANVSASCWTDSAVQLSYVAVDEAVQQLSQPTDTDGFVQTSDIRIIEATVGGVALGPVHNLGGQSVALAGTFEDVTQNAYFMALESVNISKQE